MLRIPSAPQATSVKERKGAANISYKVAPHITKLTLYWSWNQSSHTVIKFIVDFWLETCEAGELRLTFQTLAIFEIVIADYFNLQTQTFLTLLSLNFSRKVWLRRDETNKLSMKACTQTTNIWPLFQCCKQVFFRWKKGKLLTHFTSWSRSGRYLPIVKAEIGTLLVLLRLRCNSL